MYRHARADAAIVVDRYTRMKDSIVADLYVVADIDVGIYLDIVANDCPISDVGKCAYECFFSNFGRFGNIGRLLDARELLFFYLLVFCQQHCKGAIGIGNPDQCRCYQLFQLKAVVDDDDRGRRGI